jgi:hypothetical protein
MRSNLLLREAPQLDTREAAITPRTFNRADNTIEAVIATDTPVSRGSFLEILDPAGADLAALRGGSVLDAHRQDGVAAVLGTVDEAWRDGTQLVAQLRFSTRPEIAALVEDIRAGVIRSVSIGYEVTEWREGTDAQGRRTRTAVKWKPREVSFVAVAADPNARTRSREVAPGSRAAVNRQIRELARHAGVSATVVEDLVDREASIEDARGVVLDHVVNRSGLTIRASVGHDYSDPELQTRAISDALYARLSGTAPPGRRPRAGAPELDRADGAPLADNWRAAPQPRPGRDLRRRHDHARRRVAHHVGLPDRARRHDEPPPWRSLPRGRKRRVCHRRHRHGEGL